MTASSKVQKNKLAIHARGLLEAGIDEISA
jgi:hypothetical protein